MKYLCLVSFEPNIWEAMSKTEAEQLDEESWAYNQELKQRGYLITAEALQPAESATTVRVRNEKVSITDGPFTETKEVIAGFLLVEARDLNEAIQVASRVPLARYGSVEVRPVMGRDASGRIIP